MARSVNVTLVLINIILFQIFFLSPSYKKLLSSSSSTSLTASDPFYTALPLFDLPLRTSQDVIQQHLANPLAIPPGSPPNLPSVRIDSHDDHENVDTQRKIYGGSGDKKHLGGFTELDLDGISPTLWKEMILQYGVRSFMDVGCGRGTSTKWFMEHGARVLCVEGSHDAVQKSFLPQEVIVEHDFSRGPWWPEQTYDAAWSVEFLEHVSRQYHYNYISTLRKAALIFVTSSRWGGWHHVEIHRDSWWIRKFELYGFKYDNELTRQARGWAQKDFGNTTNTAPNGGKYGPKHLINSLKVFVNPAVAALPQHQHLFPEHGCFLSYDKTTDFPSVTRPCGSPGSRGKHLETPLPDAMQPLPVLPEMHQRWHDFIKSRLEVKEGA